MTKKEMIKNMNILLIEISNNKQQLEQYINLCRELKINTTYNNAVLLRVKKTSTIRELDILSDIIYSVLF